MSDAFFSALAFSLFAIVLIFFFKFNGRHSFLYLMVCHYQLCQSFCYCSNFLLLLSSFMSFSFSFTLSNDIPLNSPIIYSPYTPSIHHTLTRKFMLKAYTCWTILFFYQVFRFHSHCRFFLSFFCIIGHY